MITLSDVLAVPKSRVLRTAYGLSAYDFIRSGFQVVRVENSGAPIRAEFDRGECALYCIGCGANYTMGEGGWSDVLAEGGEFAAQHTKCLTAAHELARWIAAVIADLPIEMPNYRSQEASDAIYAKAVALAGPISENNDDVFIELAWLVGRMPLWLYEDRPTPTDAVRMMVRYHALNYIWGERRKRSDYVPRLPAALADFGGPLPDVYRLPS